MSRTPVSSLFPRNPRTLALHMAMEAAQRAEVGQRIKELRGPLPQPELARRLNVSLRAVQKWEAGESAPQWDNLVRLSKQFGVSQNFLLYGDPDQPAPERSQLDRIEDQLERVLELLEGPGIAAGLELAALRASSRPAQRDASPARKPRTRKAS